MTNKEIGERFDRLSYSAVAKECRRLQDEGVKHIGIKRKLGKIDRDLSYVKA